MATKKGLRIPKKVLGKKLDGEWVLLNLEDGRYYGLNETGSLIWDELNQNKPDFEGVLDRLEASYAADRRTLEADLEKFLDDLSEEGLVQIDGKRSP